MDDEYYAVYDVGEHGKKIPKGWKLLYTWNLGEYKEYVEFKKIEGEAELDKHKYISKRLSSGNYKVMTKQQLIKFVDKAEKAFTKYGCVFKISDAYRKLSK